MFHRERLDSSKMAFIDRVQNRKQVSRFCLDHSRARNGREIRKQIKQTCRTKQRKEKRLKHKVSGYKSQSKQRSIAGCRLLLRTLYRRLQNVVRTAVIHSSAPRVTLFWSYQIFMSSQCDLLLNTRTATWDQFVNPLHPNISKGILHTVLHILP